MEIYNLKEKPEYAKEYFELCSKEWGTNNNSEEFQKKVNDKVEKFLTDQLDKIISVLILVKGQELIGFISLFKYDGDERRDLCPWYATMYVKDKYRGLGYSKILNKSILDEVKRLGYSKVYLKTDLVNYYEKFGFNYLEDLNNGEKLYYMEVL